MSINKEEMMKVMIVFVLVSVVLCCVCYCSPVSYKEDIVEATTTPKTVRDRFIFKQEHKSVPPNDSSPDRASFERSVGLGSFGERNRELDNDEYSKVKSVMPGEKTLRQSEGDDDDDDDGGEYEGLDYSISDKTDRNNNNVQQCKPDAVAAVAVPMMIIREVDMVAMQIPVKDPQSTQKEWSEWSSCSKPCRAGKGLQSRWRVQAGGNQHMEQQFRPCYLADCDSRDFLFRPSF